MTPLGSEILDWPEAVLYILAILILATTIRRIIEAYIHYRQYRLALDIPKCLKVEDIPDEVKERIIELLEGHKDEPLDFDPSTGEYYKDRRR